MCNRDTLQQMLKCAVSVLDTLLFCLSASGRLRLLTKERLWPQDNVTSGTKYKEIKDAQRRSQAGNRAAWNTLFMRSDTVAEAVAAHYGISKSQLLSRDAADLPVRMALGEAHVIATTKKALGNAGGLPSCRDKLGMIGCF